MYNYFMLIGRLVKEPEIVHFDDGKKVCNVSIAINRPFKNVKGEIETDFYTVAFWDFLIDFVLENVKTGMYVGIKGRIQTTPNKLENGYVLSTPTLIGERLLFFPEPGFFSQLSKKED